MSAISTAVWQETCNICEKVHKVLHNTLVNFQRGRQLSANRQIMHQLPTLRHLSKDLDLDFHLDKMNDNTNKSYDAKLIK
jgi:hypothetical protein|tara:strand:+ start:602 stop:841 length:240 start_codon:yes stop_codon:yes gene_type:complete